MAGDFLTPPTLFYFSIFRDQDILFFHPPTFSIEDRQKHVGLSLGLMAFARTFGNEIACENVHSQKHRLIFMTRGSFTIALNVNLGFVIRQSAQGKRTIEFLNDSVDDDILSRHFNALLDSFQLQHGSFEYLERTVGKSELSTICQGYFTDLLDKVEFDSVIFKSTLDCVSHVVFDNSLGSKLALLCHTLIQVSPLILNVLIMSSTHLVHSTLDQKEAVLLFRHFTQFNGAKYLQSSQDGFITLPIGLIHAHGISRPIPFYLNNEKVEGFVYRANMLSAVFIIDSKVRQPEAEVFRRLDEILFPNLSTLQPYVQKMSLKKNLSTKYFDHLLLDKEHGKIDEIGDFSVDKPRLNTALAEIKHELDCGMATEISSKTTEDIWLSGRISNEKQVFSLVHQKRDAAIGDLESEFTKMKHNHFPSR